MPIWTCEICKVEFKRNRSGARPIRFCSQSCYRKWVDIAKPLGGRFRPNLIPWNKGMKGIHLSPATQFKKGQPSSRHLPIGSVTVRLRRREGYQRAFVKVAEPNVWKERAKMVWEEKHGPIPRGMVIHHKDRDALNDTLDNLQMLTKSEHRIAHGDELAEARRKAYAKRKQPPQPKQESML